VRQYNERLILQLIRRAGSLPKAEIARMTNLSAQTVSVIINRLLNDKLLQKQPRQREKGKVGQPSVPIALNPGGAYSIGVKIGRRSLDVLMIDFSGQVLERLRHRYDYPDPDALFPWIEQDIVRLTRSFTPAQHERIVGIGVVSPYSIGGWQQELGAPVKVITRWSEIDIRQRIAAQQPLPVWYANDATAACISELEFGKGARFSNYLYLFVGTFIGGGIVINGTLYTGAFDNAGALGSMPVPAAYAGSSGAGKSITTQLINCASRYLLDDRLRAEDMDPDAVIEQLDQSQGEQLPAAVREIFASWLQQTAAAIAFAVTTAISIVDFQGVIIDGALPLALIEQLVSAIETEMAGIDQEGLVRPQLLPGSIGNDARALGGAILPLYSNFAPDREVLLKLGVEAAG
jgi:predicted NBD/HSP70 family sugar kinase